MQFLLRIHLGTCYNYIAITGYLKLIKKNVWKQYISRSDHKRNWIRKGCIQAIALLKNFQWDVFGRTHRLVPFHQIFLLQTGSDDILSYLQIIKQSVLSIEKWTRLNRTFPCTKTVLLHQRLWCFCNRDHCKYYTHSRPVNIWGGQLLFLTFFTK